MTTIALLKNYHTQLPTKIVEKIIGMVRKRNAAASRIQCRVRFFLEYKVKYIPTDFKHNTFTQISKLRYLFYLTRGCVVGSGGYCDCFYCRTSGSEYELCEDGLFPMIIVNPFRFKIYIMNEEEEDLVEVMESFRY
jgi:hypothetical protein